MAPLTSAVFFVSGMTFFMGMFQLFIFTRHRGRNRAALFLGLSCLFVSAYDVFSAYLYQAESVAEGIVWQRYQLIALCCVGACFLWFVDYYTRRLRHSAAWAFSAAYVVLAIMLSTDAGGLSFDANRPLIKELVFLGLQITYYEGAPGILHQLLTLTGILAFAYVFWVGVKSYNEGRRREAGFLLAAVAVWFAGTTNDALVGSNVISSIYVLEYCYAGLVLILAYSLAANVMESAWTHELTKESGKRLELALEGADLGMWDWSSERREIIVDPVWVEKHLGYRPYDLSTNVSFWKGLIHPDDLPIVEEKLDEHFAQKTPIYYCQYRVKHRNGDWVWLSDRAQVGVRDASGKALRMTGTHLDVTESKRTREALRESEKNYRMLVENQIDLLVKLDFDGKFLFVSRSFREMFGKPQGSLLGTSFFDLLREQDRVKMEKTIVSLRERPQSSFLEQEIEVDGRLIWLSWAFKTAYDADSGIEDGIIGAGRDISEQKRAEMEMTTAKRAAESANMAKSQFLANMSHELRTPLNAIIGFSEMIEMGLVSDTKEIRTVSKRIFDSGNHLLLMINDILDISKIEAGKMVLHPSLIQIREDLELCVGLVRPKADAAQVRIRLDIADEIDRVQVDQVKFKQIISNLLTNAVKFTPEKGDITVSARVVENHSAETPWLELAICDTGIGISEAHQERLFEPFYQVDDSMSRKFEGTGLGLAIVKQLVELHHGTIVVDSAVGRGSCFTIRIPYLTTAPDLVLSAE